MRVTRGNGATRHHTSNITESAISLRNQSLVDVLSDVLELLCVGGPRYKFCCGESRLELARLQQLVDVHLDIVEEAGKLLVVLPDVEWQLQRFHVKKVLNKKLLRR